MFYGIWLPHDLLDLHGTQLPYISLTSETGQVNCFRRWDISRYDASRNLKSTCTLGLLSSEPREPWDCHVKQGSWPTRRCSAAWSKDELLQLRCHLHPSRPINLPTARHLSEGHLWPSGFKQTQPGQKYFPLTHKIAREFKYLLFQTTEFGADLSCI